ncbi:YoaK family protein [uncultured Mucilaginibacter sp.]|uniref:YoaK family protein n=1 Tax=uncultured Mucilaginibacter sp. TaxID=797541 RepID=UPI00261FBC2C|nr:YoaK family protein [uncultured Mucilaginibacter sp.]
MLRKAKEERTLKDNLMLASSTAFVAGMTNVAGVIAFLSFTSNITGHVAMLARKIVNKEHHDILVYTLWLLLFLLGAFTANFITKAYSNRGSYRAHAVPIFIEVIILFVVAVYGHNYYTETQLERELIIGTMLFSMGLQNGLVSTISGGLVKTTHLTGLFTDLGGELSEYLHAAKGQAGAIKQKLMIRLTILCFYLIGGILGGYFFERYDFRIFYFIPFILLTILYYDISAVLFHKFTKFLVYPFKNKPSVNV